jgi:hypothetical protein
MALRALRERRGGGVKGYSLAKGYGLRWARVKDRIGFGLGFGLV